MTVTKGFGRFERKDDILGFIMSKFKVFLARFLANLLILGGFAVLGYTYIPILVGEVWYQLKVFKKQEYSLGASTGSGQASVFARYLSSKPIKIVPVNREFSIVIEKIDVNAPIVPNVSVIDEKAYKESLKSGVAHAAGTAFPGEKGNVYLFAHSSLNFFELGKYATTFNLLRKLEKGDKVHIFYQNKDYIYEVIGKEVVKGFDTKPLTRKVLDPTLTLQTCHPPGTTINRLVVTAKLIEVGRFGYFDSGLFTSSRAPSVIDTTLYQLHTDQFDY